MVCGEAVLGRDSQAFLIDNHMNTVSDLEQVESTRKGANDCWLCFHTGLVNVAVFNIPAKTRTNNNNSYPGSPDGWISEEQGFETPVGTVGQQPARTVCSAHRLLQCCYQKMSLSCVNDWNFQAFPPFPFPFPSAPVSLPLGSRQR